MNNICERTSTKGNTQYPTCFNNKIEVKLVVIYNAYERDTLYLCKSCGEAIKKDAENHGYITSMMIII